MLSKLQVLAGNYFSTSYQQLPPLPILKEGSKHDYLKIINQYSQYLSQFAWSYQKCSWFLNKHALVLCLISFNFTEQVLVFSFVDLRDYQKFFRRRVTGTRTLVEMGLSSSTTKKTFKLLVGRFKQILYNKETFKCWKFDMATFFGMNVGLKLDLV